MRSARPTDMLERLTTQDHDSLVCVARSSNSRTKAGGGERSINSFVSGNTRFPCCIICPCTSSLCPGREDYNKHTKRTWQKRCVPRHTGSLRQALRRTYLLYPCEYRCLRPVVDDSYMHGWHDGQQSRPRLMMCKNYQHPLDSYKLL